MLEKVYQFARGSAPSPTVDTLFTNDADETSVVTSVTVTNNSDSRETYTLSFGGIAFAGAVAIEPHTTHMFDDVREVLTGTQTITGFASDTAVKFHVSGVKG